MISETMTGFSDDVGVDRGAVMGCAAAESLKGRATVDSVNGFMSSLRKIRAYENTKFSYAPS